MCKRKKSFLIKCKCGNEYCTLDQLPEKHECTEIDVFKQEAFEKNKSVVMDTVHKEKEEWIIK